MNSLFMWDSIRLFKVCVSQLLANINHDNVPIIGVADNVINPNDTAVEKVVKGKMVRGDYREKRKVRREVR